MSILLLGVGRGTGSGSALLTDLAAYWKLDEVSAGSPDRVDQVGISNLTCNGGALKCGSAKQGTADRFSSAFYLSHADSDQLDMGDIDFTVAGWFTVENTSFNHRMVSKYNATGNQRGYLLQHDGVTSDRFKFFVSSNGTAVDQVSANSFGAPSVDTYYFIVCRHDSVNDTISIQVNDGTVDSTAHTGGCFQNTQTFTLGMGSDGSTEPHQGCIDEVGIWKRLLTASEVTYLYNGGAGRTYPFS